MHAILLAAGVGKRLSKVTGKPKCLLEFGGQTLLDRHLDALRTCRINKLTVCVGYQRESIEAALQDVSDIEITIVYNPDFELGSVVSLWTTRSAITNDEGVLLMDADVLYPYRVLTALVTGAPPNCLLIDRDFTPGDEPVKICLQDREIVEFRKHVDPALAYTSCGESLGFFKFNHSTATALFARCGEYVRTNRQTQPHEEVLRDLILETPENFDVVDVSGAPWLEIDFPEDVERAKNEVFPRIQ
ncbi:MAG: phosphocholine cytidylyltransferase family protein [Pseudomonadota bacterium]